MPLILGAQSAAAAAATVTGGCQFNAGTTEFTLSQAAGTSTKIFTVSMWFKLGILGTSKGLWGCGTGTGDGVSLVKRNTHEIGLETWDGSLNPKLVTTRVIRDPAAWYHVVFSIDTTNATAGDRLKIWINGVEQTIFNTDVTITEDSAIPGWSGSGDTMYIGNRLLDGDAFFDGEISHVNVIDGTIYGASAFGETDETSGIWKIKAAPDVTYGTNGGFYKFESGALTTDSSGEGNTLTQAGSPTETKDNPSNSFATMNPLDNYYQSATFSNGNNTVVTTTSNQPYSTATTALSTGKWYWEVECSAATNAHVLFGIAGRYVTSSTEQELGEASDTYGYYGYNGEYQNGGTQYTYGDTWGVGDIIGHALDLTNSKLYFSINGVWQDSGDPTSGATGTGAISIVAASATEIGAYLPAVSDFGGSVTLTAEMNFGNGYFGTTAVTSANADDADIGAFEYDVPSGYYTICTNNLGNQS